MNVPVTNITNYHSVVAIRLQGVAVARETGDVKKAREMMISLVFYARGSRGGDKPDRRKLMQIRDLDELEFIMADELRQSGLTPRQEPTGGTLMDRIRRQKEERNGHL